jgi:uncharacterized membrane protein (Fun14 family)
VAYDERLWPPAWWWPLMLLWTGSLGIAFGFATEVLIGVAVFVAGVALATAVSVAMADRISVAEDGLRAGRAHLTPDAIAAVAPLDRAAAALLRGPGGDARAYLVLRGWVPTAVRIDLDDAADPHPYWYVSTRHPEQLATALHRIGGFDPAS